MRQTGIEGAFTGWEKNALPPRPPVWESAGRPNDGTSKGWPVLSMLRPGLSAAAEEVVRRARALKWCMAAGVSVVNFVIATTTAEAALTCCCCCCWWQLRLLSASSLGEHLQPVHVWQTSGFSVPDLPEGILCSTTPLSTSGSSLAAGKAALFPVGHRLEHDGRRQPEKR